MCSEYQLKTTSEAISRSLGAKFGKVPEQLEFDSIVKFGGLAPVIHATADGIDLVLRIFPVSPFPNSRLSGFDNQSDGREDASATTDDRQIRRIYEMPRWKKTFNDTPLLIPMTGFTEFAYWGEAAGSALLFKMPKEKVFFAAAIGIRPFVPKTGRENGFAILTHTATEQMLEYHQRLIVLLEPRHALTYLTDMSPEARFDFLIENRYQGELSVEKTRSMAKGWEKRTATQTSKLARERRYLETLSREGVLG